MTNTIAIIPARGGSKSIPKKNLVNLANHPLMFWTIDAAKRAQIFKQIIVSSDDTQILEFATSQGIEAIHRPKHLALDDSPTDQTICHLLDSLSVQPDLIHLLQPTSPLRTAQDIINVHQALVDHPERNGIISVSEPTYTPIKAFIERADGSLHGLYSNDAPFSPRQNLPKAFMPNGAIYAFRVTAFLDEGQIPRSLMWPYIMDQGASLDIDSIDDLQHAETLFERHKHDK